MKKSLFIALAAAGMLSACSSQDEIVDNGKGNGTVVTPSNQINIGVTTGDLKAMTRGTGTVGGIKENDNKWAGQDLWIYMMSKGTVNPAKFAYSEDAENGLQEFSIYENKKVTAPKAEAAGLVEDNDIRYYPLAGQYDFWGYRIDDAATMSQGAPTAKYISKEGTEATAESDTVKVVVPFEINGTQDLMAGKAAITTEEAEAVGDNYYSSYAARRGVQPNIAFNHLLTRFTFTVLAGNESTAGYKKVTNETTELEASEEQKAAKVEGVAIETKTKGNLVVAYKDPAKVKDESDPEAVAKAPELLEWDATQEKPVKVWLKQRPSAADESKELNNSNLVDLTAVPLTGKLKTESQGEEGEPQTATKSFEADSINIGEALMVQPGLKEYPLYLKISQMLNTTKDNEGTPKNMVQTLKTTIKASDIKVLDEEEKPTVFEAGKSYNIVIKIYGYEKIEITATLIPWKDGGTIDKDTDTPNDWTVEKEEKQEEGE